MGWETGVSLGAAGVGAFANTQNAIAQSKALAATAENQASNIANQISRSIGSLETSFIKGGISLDGVGGTQAVFSQAAGKGLTDIHRTIDNANASIADTMNKSRTQTLAGIAGAWGKIPVSTIESTAQGLYNGSDLQEAWNGMRGPLDPSADPSLPWSTGYVGQR